MDTRSVLSEESKRIRASGVLGEAKMRRLFDYLVASSLEAKSPKEITLAIDVFGKGPDFDVSQEALVRVYIHKLRKTLEEFYAARTGQGITPLHIPRGEYRLIPRPTSDSVSAMPQMTGTLPGASPAPEPLRSKQPWGRSISLGVAIAGALLLVVFGVYRWFTPSSDVELARANPIWSTVLKDNRPLLVVVGDYYLIGETDNSMEVTRLIREYSINSKEDLENYVNQHPEVADRYMDVGLRYLPTSIAFALRNIMPVLATGTRVVNLSTMSDVTPAMLKSSNIVYIGYLSGLGILQRLVFTGSRFKIGESYDELVDTTTKHTYVSQTASQNMGAPQSSGKEPSYRDYGFFSSFRGPGGNTIIVIAGTRDEGVRQTAEALTSPERLNELSRQVNGAMPFEGLLEVSALDGVNLSGKLLIEAKR
jgi:hypothetical protein